ncbi:MAG: hypothetical protein H7288_04745 [Kineosporiaceae bacterium]|nr:hypothetical protein [Aeromicrobium sp.]
MMVPQPNVCAAIYAVMTPHPLEHEDHVAMPMEFLLRLRGSSDLGMQRLRKRPFQFLIRAESDTSGARAMAFETRITALQLAEAHDGVVIDMLLPRVVEHGSAATSLSNASQWFVFEYDADENGHIMTHGLDQFGLPELHSFGVPAAQRAMYDAVLTGIAFRLIDEWPAQDPVGPATITLRDIAYGFGDPAASSTPNDRSVDVTLAYDEDEHELRVTLHDDPATSLFQK